MTHLAFKYISENHSWNNLTKQMNSLYYSISKDS